MKRKRINLPLVYAPAIVVSAAMLAAAALAQNTNVRTNTKILYHNGGVMTGSSNVYLIWYGNWSSGRPGNNSGTQGILTDLVSSLGGSPYFLINTTYPDLNGMSPSGSLLYAGSAGDMYSRGLALTESDIQGIIDDKINAGALPLDPVGIYFVIASSDVTDMHSDGTSFCYPPLSAPRHGTFVTTGPIYGGQLVKYAFIGNPMRCPSSTGPQFNGGAFPSPNGDFAADVMASTIAHLISVVITDPVGNAWFDRYGLENAAKCQGTFGQTYTTANGAQANIHLGQRDYLIQQNWVNVKPKGYCGLSLPRQ